MDACVSRVCFKLEAPLFSGRLDQTFKLSPTNNEHRTSLAVQVVVYRSTMVPTRSLFVAVLALFPSAFFVLAFTCNPSRVVPARNAPTFARQGGWNAEHVTASSRTNTRTLFMSDKDTQTQTQTQDDGVVELVDDEVEDVKASAAEASAPEVISPFLSQGEILPEALNPDLSDPQQARVIIYIIISLLPVLFLVPLMLGSRDLVPLSPGDM
jgi:hypothetical protein